MASSAYLSLKEVNQVWIEGSCEMEELGGALLCFLCYAADHDVYIPRLPLPGYPDGKRVRDPVKILKTTDKSTSKLYQALNTGEKMKEVKIEWRRADPFGKEKFCFTHVLENAVVVAVSPKTGIVYPPQNEPNSHIEEISLMYKKIRCAWEVDGVDAEDYLRTPAKA